MKNIDKKITTKSSFKKKWSILFLSLTLISLLPSCNDDEFLTRTNPNQISTGIYWKTIDDLNWGLVAVYNTFRNDNIINLVNELNRSDIAYAGSWRARPSVTQPTYLQTFNNAFTASVNKWQEGYKGIFRANQVIKASNDLMPSLTESEKEEATIIIAQARLLRGFFYYHLYNSFNKGSIPLFSDIPEDQSDFYKTPESAEVIKDFIITDLEFASETLPENWENKNKGRVTSGAALALLGNTYLHNKQYTKATEEYKKLIDSNVYSLTADIGSNFTTRNEFNEESILEASHTVDYKMEEIGYSWKLLSSGLSWRFSPSGWLTTIPSNWLTILYKNEVIDSTDPRNLLENGTLRTYSLRTSASIALADDFESIYYGYEPAAAYTFNQGNTSFWRKHTNWDISESEKDIYPSTPRSGVNERYIRLAAVYLNYAEALNEIGDTETAMLYINKIRRRSGVRLIGPNGSGEFPTNDHDNITYNQASLREHIRHVEKPLELSGENMGERNVDLIRWGIKKDRFIELATRRYDATHLYNVTDKSGNSKTRWNALLWESDPNDPNAIIDPNYSEFQEAAVNYNEENHAYWPIPNTELVTNPLINLYSESEQLPTENE
ncbi:RagB/SusD family nutrient uptake outer membrane protein [Wenyingzhuangia aestuarii]|uniref:RagB/SusD family nutrient uptake outer membrane protein n=1 Tax=Wenyingzhuangia aestuarii TaxID=1647582 RepID=UPI001438D0AA|nr:RagB/SusD family nutrient uptake outer membrane protein [Wenyingzhuangia aestuarii]NJB82541.1 tetratricopeptide (TPR) repeat protein [Wenyingzhuangia aestuarii]